MRKQHPRKSGGDLGHRNFLHTRQEPEPIGSGMQHCMVHQVYRKQGFPAGNYLISRAQKSSVNMDRCTRRIATLVREDRTSSSCREISRLHYNLILRWGNRGDCFLLQLRRITSSMVTHRILRPRPSEPSTPRRKSSGRLRQLDLLDTSGKPEPIHFRTQPERGCLGKASSMLIVLYNRYKESMIIWGIYPIAMTWTDGPHVWTALQIPSCGVSGQTGFSARRASGGDP